jgi:hypothetical protein
MVLLALAVTSILLLITPILNWLKLTKPYHYHRHHHHHHAASLVKYADTSTSPVLECFQVSQPVLTPPSLSNEIVLTDGSEKAAAEAVMKPSSGCVMTLLLMEHSFGWSYGHPFVGK